MSTEGGTRAVIAALEKRGFESKNIFLVGLNPLRLRLLLLANAFLPFAGAHDAPAPAPYPDKAAHAPRPLPDRVVLTWRGDPATTQAVTWR